MYQLRQTRKPLSYEEWSAVKAWKISVLIFTIASEDLYLIISTLLKSHNENSSGIYISNLGSKKTDEFTIARCE
jgi:hypothetical protein